MAVNPTAAAENNQRQLRSTARTQQRRARIQGGYTDSTEASGSSPTYRIDSITKWKMLTIALAFDLLPIIILIGVAGFSFSAVAGSSCAHTSDEIKGVPQIVQNMTPLGVMKMGWNLGNGIKCVAGGATAVMMLLTFGSVLYYVTSLCALVISLLWFTVWFWARNVPYLSFRKGRGVVFLTTSILECIPVLNLIPGITWNVSRQIKISHREDDELFAKNRSM